MKLVSMKLDPKDAAAEAGPATASDPKDAPRYPYGLQIDLQDDALDALGLDTLPAVDATYTLIANVTVTRVSASATQGGEECKSVGLQITDMALSEAPKGSTADRLYPSMKGKG